MTPNFTLETRSLSTSLPVIFVNSREMIHQVAVAGISFFRLGAYVKDAGPIMAVRTDHSICSAGALRGGGIYLQFDIRTA